MKFTVEFKGITPNFNKEMVVTGHTIHFHTPAKFTNIVKCTQDQADYIYDTECRAGDRMILEFDDKNDKLIGLMKLTGYEEQPKVKGCDNCVNDKNVTCPLYQAFYGSEYYLQVGTDFYCHKYGTPERI